jgi:hypothetical protein
MEVMWRILIIGIVAVNISLVASDDVTALGIAQITRASTGYGYGAFQTQSSPISPGIAVEYRHWFTSEGRWRDHGIEIAYSLTSSGASFANQGPPYGVIAFGLNRHEFNVGYVRRFRADSFLSPYVKAGAGGFITNGGAGPGGILGIDGQANMVGEVGADTRMTRHIGIRYGMVLYWFRAPNFSDVLYHGSRTTMLEPRIGLTWHF